MSNGNDNDDITTLSNEIDRINISDNDICANCGKEGASNICNKCKQVKYCNAACKKRHRHKHKNDCEEHLKRVAELHDEEIKRAAELHDIELFKQPPPEEDCPICFIRLPSKVFGHRYSSCCGKNICNGCVHAMRMTGGGSLKLCPLCRTPTPTTNEKYIEQIMRRTEVNDAEAIRTLAGYYSNGESGLPEDVDKALELWHQAAELGDVTAYSNIGVAYYNGHGINRDKKKALHYYELAAMGGHIEARYRLGALEEDAGNIDRALRHYMIAVRNGSKDSLTVIQDLYSRGKATKDEYTKALRAYQRYLGEVKSSQRDEAAAALDEYKYVE